MPFGQSGSLANGAILAGDFDTFDVARIEVLRGPQGTLYGSNSLGGVLKYITNAPSTERVEVRAQGGVETSKRGDTGYLANAMVNVPLGEMLAVRASGYYHRTPGTVDRIGLAATNVDRADSYGGRGTILFKPTSTLSVKLFGLLQNIAADSPSAFDANPLTLRPVNAVTAQPSGKTQLRYERYPEFHNIDYRLGNGTIDFDAGFATLSSITSYATQRQHQISDISTTGTRGTAGAIYGGVGGGAGNVGLAFRNNASLKKFTQELRLVTPTSTLFDFVLGGYYTRETTALSQEFLPFNFTTTALIPTPATFAGLTFNRFVYADINAHYRELAAYANGTLHLGTRFDLTLGGRYSDNKQDSFQQVVQLGGGTPVNGRSQEGVFTWSIAPRFEINDRTAVYARVAKGYRPGGPNFVPAGATSTFPTEFNSDTLVSYEAGLKAETADRTFGIDLAGFYVDWDNILILSSATVGGQVVGINGNGQKARTYGGEGTVTLRPTAGLEMTGNLAYTRANLRGDTVQPGALNLSGGLDGDELPFVPRWAGTMSADYRWQMGDIGLYVGGDVHLQDNQKGGFSAAYRAAYGRQLELDGYSTVNLRAGADIGNFTVQLYARNLLDEQGVINASGYPFSVPAALGGTATPLIRATTVRPRTLGAVVGVRF